MRRNLHLLLVEDVGWDNQRGCQFVNRSIQKRTNGVREGSMTVPRSGAALTACIDHLFIFGSISLNDRYLDTCEEYNPTTKTWTQLDCKMAVNRVAFGAVALNGFVYLVGGHCEQGELASVQCFDPLAGRFMEVCSLSCPRSAVAVACCTVAKRAAPPISAIVAQG